MWRGSLRYNCNTNVGPVIMLFNVPMGICKYILFCLSILALKMLYGVLMPSIFDSSNYISESKRVSRISPAFHMSDRHNGIFIKYVSSLLLIGK